MTCWDDCASTPCVKHGCERHLCHCPYGGPETFAAVARWREAVQDLWKHIREAMFRW